VASDDSEDDDCEFVEEWPKKKIQNKKRKPFADLSNHNHGRASSQSSSLASRQSELDAQCMHYLQYNQFSCLLSMRRGGAALNVPNGMLVYLKI